MINEVKFPIILLTKEESMQVYNLLDQITHLTTLAFKKDTLTGRYIFNSNNRAFRINKITLIGKLAPWWVFGYFNPMLKVDVAVAEIILSLDESKKLIMHSIRDNAEFWNEGDIAKVIERVLSCKELSEIIQCLQNY